jgi:ubiquinone/menaquinone biosynthesis C-methylase UbiE
MRLDDEFSSIPWLRDHHEGKLAERRRIVTDLDLHKGYTVLDAGCGPGLWLSLLSEGIGRSGRIVGYDLDYRYLRHAQELHGEQQGHPSTIFVQGDFAAIPFRTKSFDLVFSCNALLYHPAPLELLRNVCALTKPGGRIAVVHFDDAMTCYYPIEPELTLRVLTATAEALRGTSSDTHYDNYLGRKLHSLFIESGLINVKTLIHPIFRHAPLDEHIEKHIKGIAHWQARVGAAYLDDETQQTWLSYFDLKSPNYVLKDSRFSFYTVEFLTMGARRSVPDLTQEVADG